VTPLSGAIIRVLAAVSNKGRLDTHAVGAAAAVLMQGGDRGEEVHSWCMGMEVTQFDVDVFALTKMAEWLTSYYTRVVPPTDIYILSGSHSALQFITKANSLVNQQVAILFKNSLTSFFSVEDHRDMRFHLVWAPVCRKRAQDNTARARVLEAILVAPLAGLNCMQSATYLKRVACLRVFTKWSTEWKDECELQCWTNKLDHFAYSWSILEPPDGKNNPVWCGVITIPTKSKGKIRVPSRYTTSTLLHFTVGHGFFSDYSTWFRKDLPDKSHFCPCCTAPRNMLYLIYDCPRFQHIRNQRDFAEIHHSVPLDTYFTDPATALTFVKFLSEGCIGFKPEEGSIIEYHDSRPSASSARPLGPTSGTVRALAANPGVVASHLAYNTSAPFDPG
jgi:hypothetical protein